MQPNSKSLIVVLLLVVLLLLWAMVRYRRWFVRGAAGLLVVALSALTGMAVVNDYYGYYQSWSQLHADLTGSYSSFATTVASRSDVQAGHGRLEPMQFAGARSHINRPGLVYLPPQYFQKRFATTRFPVVELLHGTPGVPSQWVVQLQVVRVMDQLLAKHQIGPMILVMPMMSVGHDYQECVDAPKALDDTYITYDVRADVLAHFRASTSPAQWGVAGYSSGGYCAANLALRHPGEFGAAGMMDAYFRPQDGPAAAALHNDPRAEAANNPIALAAALPRTASPLPSFWISAGTGVPVDIHGALAFTRALHGVEAVPLFKEPGAGHNFYAWASSLPHLLTWSWTQLADPSLRVQFPIAGSVRSGILFAPKPLVVDRVVGKGAHRHRKQVLAQAGKAAARAGKAAGAGAR